ncbi:MAG: metallophosphoesterase [Verrucomicrobiota bacterium]
MIRILSDVHFGYPSTRVKAVEQLAPLVEGVERVVFNGDTVEMRFPEERARAEAAVEALRLFCRAAGAEPVFLTGNHDPAITETHHLELANGAVLVTHGDILFHGLSPWSTEARLLHAAHDRELAALGHPADLPRRLLALRRAAMILEPLGEKLMPRVKPGLWHALAEHFWPPWRPLRILGGWAQTPFLANALAARDTPGAQCVVLGHTHFSGVWRMGTRMIVNTGGFIPMGRPLAVDMDGATLTVRQIVYQHGLLRPGRIVARREFGR